MAYVGRVCTLKYIRLLHNIYEDLPKDNKSPEASAPILNDNTPEGVRRGVYNLVPFYIWLCGLYNKIVTPEGFSNFCGYPGGVDGTFLGDDSLGVSSIEWDEEGKPLTEPKAEGENLYTSYTYKDNNISPKGNGFFDSFDCGGFKPGAVEGVGSLARWKEELKKALQARQAEAVESTLKDARYPTIMLDAKKTDQQRQIIEKVAPAVLSLADLPRLR
jgi:hypothetical protein